MSINKIISTVLALGITTFAAAGDVSTDEAAATQDINVASAANRTSKVKSRDKVKSPDTAAAADNMAGFKAIVTAVMADNDRSDKPADKGHLDRHLGLGFAHGMSNNNKVNYGSKGDVENNPHNDACNGNGHKDNGKSRGKGHEQYKGNGFGHRDCGEPSPAD